MLLIYRIIRPLVLPLSIIALVIRSIRGKEEFSRLREKLGYSTITRPVGKLIWCHAASIGEAKAAITLIQQIHGAWPQYSFLLTTGTTTSARIVTGHFKTLNSASAQRFYHQFIPIDEYFTIQRFLKHWQPNCIIFLESELWPNMLNMAKKVAPVILANARMSLNSAKRWAKCPALANQMLNNFSKIIAQSQGDADIFSKLGAQNVSVGPNLKFFNDKLPVEQKLVDSLRAQTKQRTVICLASSHEGDEEIILNAYSALKNNNQKLLCIIAPRHLQRVSKITSIIQQKKLTYILRSSNTPIQNDTDIYIADSIGELGNIFSISDITIIGGSFKNGGHNPLEPAHFENVIVWGPDMTNFSLIAQQMKDMQAAIECSSIQSMENELQVILEKSPKEVKLLKQNGQNFVKSQLSQIDIYRSMIEPFLNHD